MLFVCPAITKKSTPYLYGYGEIIQKTPLSKAEAKEFAGFSMGKNAQSYFFMECFSQKPTAAATKPTTVSVIFTIHAKSMDSCVIWNTCFSMGRNARTISTEVCAT